MIITVEMAAEEYIMSIGGVRSKIMHMDVHVAELRLPTGLERSSHASA